MSPDSPLTLVLDALAGAGRRVTGTPGNHMAAQCPAHNDEHASLSITEAEDGKVLLHCHAGCEPEAVCKALKLTMADLFPARERNGHGGAHRANGHSRARKAKVRCANLKDLAAEYARWKSGQVESTHVYENAQGAPVFGVARVRLPDGSKQVPQAHPEDGLWAFGGVGNNRPPYRMPALVAAPPDVPIQFHEGEQKADLAARLGFVATSCSEGAGKANRTDFSPFRGRVLHLFADNDTVGISHMQDVAQRAYAAGATCVWNVVLPGLPPKGDLVDFYRTRKQAGAGDETIADDIRDNIAQAEQVPQQASQDGETEHPENEAAKPDDGSSDLVPVFDPKRTLATAEAAVARFYTHADGPTVRSYAGLLWLWENGRWVEVEDEALRQEIHPWLDSSATLDKDGNRKPFPANPRTTGDVIETIRSLVHLPATMAVPSWLSNAEAMPPPGELLSCKTMNLHIPSGSVLQQTPRLFNFNGLDFDYDPAAPEPVRWIAFLRELFGDDAESIGLLQEFFGYVLTANTSLQKALLLVGPRRSGKGTIARVLRRLVGLGNCVGPTTSSLAGNFGLQPLIGKTLAVVSDARFTGESIGIVVERLLCITGEDAISIERKFLGAVTMKLTTRFVFLTNDLPRFNDSSAALVGRFLLLELKNSFYGNENINLTDELLTELPSILRWALEGWHRLHDRGHFVEPESAKEAVQDLADLSSPVTAFLRERCTQGPERRTPCRALYTAWQAWCLSDGRVTCTTKQTFGKDLKAAAPWVRRHEGTDGSFYSGVALR